MKKTSISKEERRRRLSVPCEKLRLVLDTDAKNEIDDQFAIAWALKSTDRFDVEAVYAAPFSHDCLKAMFTGEKIEHAAGFTYAEAPGTGMEQSYEEICKLYGLLGLSHENKVFRGSDGYIVDQGGAVESEAARDLVDRAMNGEGLLYVAAFGAITNIASAILIEPEIVNKIVVVWLGGQPLYFDHALEFNLMQDVAASQVLFNSGVPLVYIPCMNVASLLAVTADEVKRQLMGNTEIGDYLGQNVLDAFVNPQAAIFAAAMYRKSYLLHREDQEEEYLKQFQSQHVACSRIIWDVATIAFLKNPTWAPSTLETSPVLNDDLTWGEPDGSRHEIRVVNYCYRDLIFGDLFACLTGNGESR